MTRPSALASSRRQSARRAESAARSARRAGANAGPATRSGYFFVPEPEALFKNRNRSLAVENTSVSSLAMTLL